MDNYNQENPHVEENGAVVRRETSHPFNKENLGQINGRMGRLDFAILIFTITFIGLLIQKTIGINPVIIGVKALVDPKNVDASFQSFLMISLASTLLITLLTVKRFRDIGYSGWLALIFVAPLLPLGFISALLGFAGFILKLILLFAPGIPNTNRFGPIPDGNKRQKLFLLLLSIIALYVIYSGFAEAARPIIEPVLEEFIEQQQ